MIDVRKALAREGRVKQSGNTAYTSSLYPLKDAETFFFYSIVKLHFTIGNRALIAA